MNNDKTVEHCAKCNATITRHDIVKMDKITPNDILHHYFIKCPICGLKQGIHTSVTEAVWEWNWVQTHTRKQLQSQPNISRKE